MKLNGDIVKLLRTTKGIDQRTLSKGTSISQTAICSIETGKMPISPKNEQRLIRFFGISEADLIHANNIVQMSKRFK
ncbi:helix-turn-helix transcriptional regulator [Bacillus sp. V3B]|uniref:helix-turn-helix domain-containing protein n=1 Tax=Bacillus sp. V3B TaxID=2804915 RepID=UPI00210D9113|nr:helix-turn-helix transcriptional regulator [Bacillus sp. V3B]MCQ6277314.1 helix-turn-helix transcriptional regulator [Bacillus sp. V3B]